MNRPTALYRFFDDTDALLYFGITVNSKARDYQHASKSAWWPEAVRKDIQWYETWVEADEAEKASIITEQPRHNIAGATSPPKPQSAPRRALRGVSPATNARLRTAAGAARRAQVDLLDAMVEASQDGATNLDIAKEIDFFYNPDYIGKLITKKAGPRKPGRRPKRD